MPTLREAEPRRKFRLVNTFPEHLTAEEMVEKQLAVTNLGHEISNEALGRKSIDIQFDTREPVTILFIGDLHTSGFATNHEKIAELRDYILRSKNTYIFLTGDMIEAIKMVYLSTNVTQTGLTFTQQIEFFREWFLKPLYEAGKVLGVLNQYTAHENWAMAAETIDAIKDMTRGMDIEHIRQGGVARLSFPRSEPVVIQMFHNPPGKSQYDPVHGLRMKMLSQSKPIRPDVITAADIHRTGQAQDLFAGTDGDTPATMLQGGTMKGSDKDHADILGINWALPQAEPGVPALVIRPTRRGEKGKHIVPVPDFYQAQTYYEALTLYDRALQTGALDDWKELIHKKLEAAPEKRFIKDESQVDRASYREKPSKRQAESNRRKARLNGEDQSLKGKVDTQQYNRVVWNIKTRLPVRIDFMANVGLGGEYENAASARTYLRDIVVPNPHAFVMFMRNMIDRDTGRMFNRERILQRYLELIALAGDQGLSILFDASMHNKGWLQDIGPGYSLKRAIAPGAKLASETNLPLLRHLSRIDLRVGPSANPVNNLQYPGVVLDKLQNHGSQSKATFGQMRMYQLYENAEEKPAFIVGGHMPNAGFSRWFDASNQYNPYPVAIAHGFHTKYTDEMGLGNIKPGAEPGQSLILVPGMVGDEHLMIPTANEEQTDWLYWAMFLQSGFKQLELTDKMMKKKSKKK